MNKRTQNVLLKVVEEGELKEKVGPGADVSMDGQVETKVSPNALKLLTKIAEVPIMKY